MEHGKKHRKFGRETKQRTALLRGLLVALISNAKITTTEAKAKSLKTAIEKLITQAKRGDLTARKSIVAKVGSKAAVKLMHDAAKKFAERTSGFTRIHKLTPRRSDGAKIAVIEFV